MVENVMNVKKGDKVIVKKDLKVFGRVFAKTGEEFEISDIFYNSIHLKDGNDIITVDKQTFNEHFEKRIEKHDNVDYKRINEKINELINGANLHNDIMSNYKKDDGNAKNDLLNKILDAMNNDAYAVKEKEVKDCAEEIEGVECEFEYPNRVTQEMVDEIIENSEVVVDTLFDRMTFVACKLPNGFIITETSACIDPENYNEDMGIDICMDKIISKVYELEAYRLMDNIHYLKNIEELICDEECCCGCGCSDKK